MAMKEKIRKVAEETAEFLGLSVYEFHFLFKGENSRVTVKIDSLEGVSHENCADFSNEFCARMEEQELLPNFSLEVSSPGLNRRLESPDDFHRFLDSPVKISYKCEGEGKFLMGTLSGAHERGVRIISDNNKEFDIEYGNIVNANLNF